MKMIRKIKLRHQAPIDLKIEDYQFRDSDCSHCHNFHELVLVLGGAGLHLTDKGEYPIYPGDVFVIPPGALHGYRNLKKLRIANILYFPKRLKREFRELRSLPGFPLLDGREQSLQTLAPELFLKARELVLQMESESERADVGSRFLFRLLFFELLTQICRSPLNGRRKNQPVERSVRVCRVIRYCELHYRDSITLEDLAGEISCSVATLTRIFREETGNSPTAYLNRMRLEHAAELLRESTLSISEIAGRNGFADSNYFSLCFRKMFGQSPRAYRKAPVS